MIDFKLNGKKVQMWSSWDDLTFNDYCEVAKKGGDLLQLVCYHHRVDYDIIKNATIIGLEEVIMSLSFLKKSPIIPPYVSKVGKYELPATKNGKFDITLESLGQFEDMRNLIKKVNTDTGEDFLDSYPHYVAIYLQKIRDGQYDYLKAKEMVAEVREMNAMEVISLGSFFLVKLLNLILGTPDNSHRTNQSQKKSKRATTSSRKHSAATARSRKPR